MCKTFGPDLCTARQTCGDLAKCGLIHFREAKVPILILIDKTKCARTNPAAKVCMGECDNGRSPPVLSFLHPQMFTFKVPSITT